EENGAALQQEATPFDADDSLVADPAADGGADAREGAIVETVGRAAAEQDLRARFVHRPDGSGAVGRDQGYWQWAVLDPPEEVLAAGPETRAARRRAVMFGGESKRGSRDRCGPTRRRWRQGAGDARRCFGVGNSRDGWRLGFRERRTCGPVRERAASA